MSGVVDYLQGFLQIEIKGANPQELLNVLAQNGVRVRDCVPVDAYTLRIKTSRKGEARLLALAGRAGCEAVVLRRRGAPFFMRGLKSRAALFAGLFLTLALLAVSSLHIWEIDVTGNETVSTSRILLALEDCGVSLGSFWPSMATDTIRNLVIARIPELSFLSVNISGSRAEVVVRERTPIPEIYDEDYAASVIAGNGGIITQIRAYRGAVGVLPGQTVLPGEVLVSGAVSSFQGMRAEHASADVTARTWYEISAVGPLSETRKEYTGGRSSRYALFLGGARINFYVGTGISGDSCDKIIIERPLAIRGVFALPVKLVAERLEEYESVVVPLDPGQVNAELEASLMTELLRRLGGRGEILSHSYSRSVLDDAVYVTLRAECLENIATERPLTDEELADIERANTKQKEEEQNE